ncbi:peptide deformylase [Labrys monachus]|uniref:Peptide deformylase-like n=2 Tax=Labrys monachus TaxID=217067 RepID=A0ABU0FG25_9HYPH|nr:peptide deformylase [Labrys monachus]
MPAAEVLAFDAETRALADDLRDTMRAAPGIGITAPHLGILKRLVVIELPDEAIVRIYVNPRIVWMAEETREHAEGSVSMPGVTETVERPARVRLRYHDLDGVEHEEEAEGLLGVCLQHEIDQLDGIFWIQRLSRLRRERVVKRFGKMTKAA